MNGKVIDSNFILNVIPNWPYGLNHGFTYDQTGRIADDTYWELERFYEKYRPHKWPEEKPVVPDEVEFKVYLARYKIDDEFIFMDSVAYYKDTGWGTSGVTHWWELPEVTE